jgi:hypothetical protein
MAEVEELLAHKPRLLLEEILLAASSRFSVVVTFLAVLEMWHQARIKVEQDELFGPIYVLRAPHTPAVVSDTEDISSPTDEPPSEPTPAATTPAKPRRAKRATHPRTSPRRQ